MSTSKLTLDHFEEDKRYSNENRKEYMFLGNPQFSLKYFKDRDITWEAKWSRTPDEVYVRTAYSLPAALDALIGLYADKKKLSFLEAEAEMFRWATYKPRLSLEHFTPGENGTYKLRYANTGLSQVRGAWQIHLEHIGGGWLCPSLEEALLKYVRYEARLRGLSVEDTDNILLKYSVPTIERLNILLKESSEKIDRLGFRVAGEVTLDEVAKLCYRKEDNASSWGLYIVKDDGATILRNASKEYRIKAAHKLEMLVEVLRRNTDDEEQKLSTACAVVERFLEKKV